LREARFQPLKRAGSWCKTFFSKCGLLGNPEAQRKQSRLCLTPGKRRLRENGKISKEKGGWDNIMVERTDKLMYPDDGITKGDLVDYYRRMAQIMLPHMKDRPLTLQRFPNGIAEDGFYQKEAPDYFPDWIKRVAIEVAETGEKQDQIVCNDEATLVYLANQACITPHIWLSRADKLHFPDKLIFDLDPPDSDFDLVRQAARDLHAVLDEVGLASYVMTTGSRGLHVVVPLDRSADFNAVRDFAHALANLLAQQHPQRLTTAQRKSERGDRLFLDYLRNAYGQNSVPPYALRPKAGAPVAAPLDWEEINRPDLTSQSYNMNNIFRRLGQKEDPWREMMHHAQSLDQARERLELKMGS
jgi:bifunctional non-homologous end joining protein LigD